MKKEIQLLKIVFDFLSELNETQLDDLIMKKTKIKLDLPKKKEVDEMNIDIKQITSELENKLSREEASDFFEKLSLNKNELKFLIKHYSIPSTNKSTKIKMVDLIIEAAIGSKIKFNAIYNTNLE